jgi:hypothetical protein
MKEYVVITTISHFRLKYIVPADEYNEPIDLDNVTDFSQMHISEDIIASEKITEDEALALFDAENQYLRNWPRSKKIDFINNNE